MGIFIAIVVVVLVVSLLFPSGGGGRYRPFGPPQEPYRPPPKED